MAQVQQAAGIRLCLPTSWLLRASCTAWLLSGASAASPAGHVVMDVRPEGRIIRLEPHDVLAERQGRSASWNTEGLVRSAARPEDEVDANWDNFLLKPGTGLAREEEGAEEAVFGAPRSPAPPNVSTQQNLTCRRAVPAQDIGVDAACPEQCPYFAEDGRQRGACYFKCVRAEDCGNPAAQVHLNHTIADEDQKLCRSCRVTGCSVCTPGKEECSECLSGYTLEDGKCVSSFRRIRNVAVLVFAAPVFYILLWYLDLLCCRRAENEDGVQRGLRHRSLAKLRKPKEGAAEGQVATSRGEDPRAPLVPQAGNDAQAPPTPQASTRPLWPLSTNMLTSSCGGPGTALHMRYQVFLLVVAAFILSVWVAVASSKDKRMYTLGTRTAKTPRDLCRVVHEGHEMEMETLRAMVLFLAIIYPVLFVACIIFAITQHRCFQAMDDQSTMKDFAALVFGLPKLSGKDPQEDVLRDLLSAETGEKLVGVSVCWEYTEQAVQVAAAIDWKVDQLEAEVASASGTGTAALREAAHDAGGTGGVTQSPEVDRPAGNGGPAEVGAAAPGSNGATAEEGAPPRTMRDKVFGVMDGLFLEGPMDEEAAAFQARGDEAVAELVKSLESTNYAFAVFETEAARDNAVNALAEKGGAEYQGSSLYMRKVDAEPSTVRWCDFSKHENEVPRRLMLGIVMVLGTLAIWTAIAFVPNTIFTLSYSYQDENSEPGGSTSYIMMVVVIIGNQFMYFVCALVSEWVGFHFEDEREAAYTVLYTGAILISVCLDMLVTFYVSYIIAVAANSHTYSGKLVKDLTNPMDIIDSFPIQKALGRQLWEYCFPATFLGGYIAEVAIVIIPYHFQRLVLRSHAGVGGVRAERTMASWMVMDMGRYADVLVNLLLTALIFFVPSGYFVQTLVALIGSHLYIYIYDHYRMLRCAPGFYYAGATIDKCAQRLLVLPLGIILACLTHKLNQSRCAAGKFCLKGDLLSILMADMFLVHVALHWALLVWFVPRFGGDHARSELTFDQLASLEPATWFSTNPVHCLRSRCFYKHSPPCSFYVRGKEHLMQANPKALSYFTDTAATPEEY